MQGLRFKILLYPCIIIFLQRLPDYLLKNSPKNLKTTNVWVQFFFLPGDAAVVAAPTSFVATLRRFASRILPNAGPRSRPEIMVYKLTLRQSRAKVTMASLLFKFIVYIRCHRLITKRTKSSLAPHILCSRKISN